MISVMVFIIAAIIFFTAFLIHVIIWRFFRPRREINALFIIFILIPALLTSAVFICIFREPLRDDILFAFVLHIVCACVYIQTYPAIQAWSPSLFIVFRIGIAKRPITGHALRRMTGRGMLVTDRMHDLQKEGMLSVHRGRLILSPKGKVLAGLFIAYRAVLGLPEGRG